MILFYRFPYPLSSSKGIPAWQNTSPRDPTRKKNSRSGKAIGKRGVCGNTDGIVEFSRQAGGNDHVQSFHPLHTEAPALPSPERSVNPPRTRGARERRGFPRHDCSRPEKAPIHPFWGCARIL